MRARVALLAAVVVAGLVVPSTPVRLAALLFGLVGASLLWVMVYLSRRRGRLALKAAGLLVPLVLPYALWPGLPLLGPRVATALAGLGVAAGVSVALLLAQHRQVRVALDRDIAGLMGPLPPDRRRLLWAFWAAPVAEEMFFRGYLVTIGAAVAGMWALPSGAALFTLYHYLHPRSGQRFDAVTYAAHFLCGLGWGAVFLWTGALWPCIVAHLLYNVPFYVMLGRRAALPAGDAGEAG